MCSVLRFRAPEKEKKNEEIKNQFRVRFDSSVFGWFWFGYSVPDILLMHNR